MNILSIESSCDETAVAIVRDGREILTDCIASQVELHKLYGGVVPEIASRKHIEAIYGLADQALVQSGLTRRDLDAIAVTYAPGLIGAVLVGVNFAKAAAYALDLPLVPVHHIRGHIAANYLAYPELEPPFICLVVSGGHTLIVDEFDTDNGFSGKVQYCLSIRDPRIADTSQSNGFESDNCGDASLIEPYTTAVFSNVTFIGPLGRDANFVNNESYITGGSFNPNNGSALGKFQSAMQIRRSSRLNCFNSVAVGYPVGLIIDGEKGNTVEMAKAGNIKLENIWFAGMTVVGSDANKVYDDVLYDAVNKQIIDAGQESYSSTFFKTQKGNKVLTDVNELKFKDGRNIGVNYMPDADSPVLTAASFNDALLSSGFETVEYIGAFGTDDNWLDGWTNFDPNNTDY